jgi:hypothetical protein
MKSIHKALLVNLLINGAILLTSQAVVANDVIVDVPPPPDRHELAPKSRDGYVWASGHWVWMGHFYKWTSGIWIPAHHGLWVADRWEQVGTQWHYLPGHWDSAAQPISTLQAQDRR